MRIAINAISFTPGRMGGMEVYLRNLLRGLRHVDPAGSYRVICRSDQADSLGESFPFPLQPIPYRMTGPRLLFHGIARNLFRFDPLARRFAGVEADVIHHPFTAMKPMGLPLPAVLTFHDMQEEFFPSFFTPGELARRKMVFRASAARADRIIAISAFTGQCLVERYGIAPGKIDVVHLGCGEEFAPLRDERLRAETAARHDLRRPFLYYPAAAWPHKNHLRLLDAVRLMKERYRFDGALVLSGMGMDNAGRIMERVRQLRLEDEVKVVGYLDNREIPVMYNLARALVFPSLFEGFGMPVIEAMACGCPVAASNDTALGEVVGDAGLLFDPLSVEEIAETIWRVWSEEETRQRLRLLGTRRAREFSWEQTAKKTAAVYRKATETP